MKGIYHEIVKRTLRVPASIEKDLGERYIEDGKAAARQLDIALMSEGFKLSKDLLKDLSKCHPIAAKDVADDVLPVVKDLIGDHVKHNAYFIDYPENVPDTIEFWTACITDALLNPDSAGKVAAQLQTGVVNLLDLPKYGKYQHSYEEMVEAHDQFIPSLKDRVTILHLGKGLIEETVALYHSLAGSSIPLNEDDRELLLELARVCMTDSQPESIPVRENKALINQVRLEDCRSLLVDTTTDVLRLACALSDGDVTLQEKTKFKSFPRKTRRAMMGALDGVIKDSPGKLADVNQYKEQWKRLGERLHPHEYQLPEAQDVFAVARRDRLVRSLAAKAEMAFANRHVTEAISLLSNAPGMLFRNIDRILRTGGDSSSIVLLGAVEKTIGKVSGRVILSLREHLQNRLLQKQSRIFANSKGTAWVETDTRGPFDSEIVNKLCYIFDKDIAGRLPACDNLLVDKDVLDVAVPLSDKSKSSGFGIMPRGSVTAIDGNVLRFFMHWKQTHETTDYDLSALLLDEDFEFHGQLSYTELRGDSGKHSGDLTSAPNGSSEFIDIDLNGVGFKYVIPQVNIYSGESFEEVEESFFGFMLRTPEQKGKPFEPRTVRMKSDLRAKGKVALPIVFMKNGAGKWEAKWMHLYLKGKVRMNRIEANKMNTTLLAKTIIDCNYLRVGYLVTLMQQKATSFSWYEKGQKVLRNDTTYIGIEAPDETLKDSSKIYTLANLRDLIPV